MRLVKTAMIGNPTAIAAQRGATADDIRPGQKAVATTKPTTRITPHQG